MKVERDAVQGGIEEEQIEIEPARAKFCNFDFKELFIQKKGKMTPEEGFPGSEQAGEYCTGVESSCCSREEFEELFVKVNEGFQDFLQNISKFPQFSKALDSIDEIKLDAFLDQSDRFDLCFLGDQSKKEKRESLLQVLTELQIELEGMLKNYSQYIKEIFLSQFKLQCGICDKKNSNYFLYDRES